MTSKRRSTVLFSLLFLLFATSLFIGFSYYSLVAAIYGKPSLLCLLVYVLVIYRYTKNFTNGLGDSYLSQVDILQLRTTDCMCLCAYDAGVLILYHQHGKGAGPRESSSQRHYLYPPSGSQIAWNCQNSTGQKRQIFCGVLSKRLGCWTQELTKFLLYMKLSISKFLSCYCHVALSPVHFFVPNLPTSFSDIRFIKVQSLLTSFSSFTRTSICELLKDQY